jgi:hypothetical protein
MLCVVAASAQPAAAEASCGGRPTPEGKGFMVSEFSAGVRLSEKSGPSDNANAFAWWGLGYLKNVDRQNALGGSVKLAADSDGHRYGPLLRYRRWLDHRWGLDLGAGRYLGAKDTS